MRDTHCARGHEFTEENTYVDPKRGARKCRTCMAAARARFNHRQLEPVEIVCPKCKSLWVSTARATADRNRPERAAKRDPYLCPSCTTSAGNLGRPRAVRLAPPAPLPPRPKLEPVDWRKPEEREDKYDYWRSRFTPDQILELAAPLHEVLDVGGQAARKYRMRHNRKQRAA